VPREGFPWARVMRLGLGELRLPPDAFWRMSLRELVAAFELPSQGLQRRDLNELMQAWPDEE
jgi:uncharacterized phage protein (TIGR02216 family)